MRIWESRAALHGVSFLLKKSALALGVTIGCKGTMIAIQVRSNWANEKYAKG